MAGLDSFPEGVEETQARIQTIYDGANLGTLTPAEAKIQLEELSDLLEAQALANTRDARLSVACHDLSALATGVISDVELISER